MTVPSRLRQRGISFIGLIFLVSVLAMVGVVSAQVFPTVMEFLAVGKAAQKAASEGQTPAQIRAVFTKLAAIDSIQSIRAEDLDITKEGDKVIVGYRYEREIHLTGPAYLTLKYEGQSK